MKRKGQEVVPEERKRKVLKSREYDGRRETHRSYKTLDGGGLDPDGTSVSDSETKVKGVLRRRQGLLPTNSSSNIPSHSKLAGILHRHRQRKAKHRRKPVNEGGRERST